eukprot:CAMPEP_0172474692 /NCGR_PEP_ID=MMETSP1065-20121228/69490_1 /TAXON_ID=265537 /ORGANISM="Amphiprora paludosa, Strain CCMP125" /LENGTH=302 /DNA_ID=CAMNT_0013232881 /DNA_START=97 /DNA_END=1005 /DNA_ORIENTATION=-
MMEKPKHPLSSYNLFFLVQRSRIVKGLDQVGVAITPREVRAVIVENKTKASKKRLHRRSHGKISFKELTTEISRRWKSVDAVSRKVLDDAAIAGQQAYAKERDLHKAWKLSQAKKYTAPQDQPKEWMQMESVPAKNQDLNKLRGQLTEMLGKVRAKIAQYQHIAPQETSDTIGLFAAEDSKGDANHGVYPTFPHHFFGSGTMIEDDLDIPLLEQDGNQGLSASGAARKFDMDMDDSLSCGSLTSISEEVHPKTTFASDELQVSELVQFHHEAAASSVDEHNRGGDELLDPMDANTMACIFEL